MNYLENITMNFIGYLSQLDSELVKLGYFSEYEYISTCQDDLKEYKNIVYTDMRNTSNHITIEFEILEDDPDYGDLWINVTNLFYN